MAFYEQHARKPRQADVEKTGARLGKRSGVKVALGTCMHVCSHAGACEGLFLLLGGQERVCKVVYRNTSTQTDWHKYSMQEMGLSGLVLFACTWLFDVGVSLSEF